MVGYSGTPLAKKLGVRSGDTIYAPGAPPHYRALLEPDAPGMRIIDELTPQARLVHIFTTSRSELAQTLSMLRATLESAVPVWVSWPKKAAKVPNDITEDAIREICLPMGYVDVKVCAVDEVWSGLKLVVRKELR